MDDAPYTGDLDLASITTRGELAAYLRTLHLRAGGPSLRTLEERTRHAKPPLRKTVVSEMLKGARFPRKPVLVTFLRACGVSDDHIAPWLRAWERIIAPGHDVASGEVTPVMRGKQSHDGALADQRTARSRTNAAINAHEGKPGVGRAGDPSEEAADLSVEQLRDQLNQLNALNNRLRLQLAARDRRPPVAEPTSPDTASARAGPSPPARRRELGILLRTLRENANLTIEQVAERLLCSTGKVKRMEANFRAGTLRDVRDLCDFYGVADESERNRMMQLAREGKQQAWWQPYNLAYADYVGLEAEAVVISAFQSSVVTGLLQTADYARAGHESAMPRLDLNRIEKQIEAKLTRQRILTQENPPRFAVILDEAALHRMVGGRQVMAAQLAKILDVSALPNVTVQILPFGLGSHPALESNFSVLELPSPTPGAVYVEGLIGSIYLEHKEDLERYRGVFNKLQSIALGPEESYELIARRSRAYQEPR